MDSLAGLKGDLYGLYRCGNITAQSFDAQSVQLKLDGGQILLYCPLQFYQIGSNALQPRPIDQVVSAPLNITVKEESNLRAARSTFSSAANRNFAKCKTLHVAHEVLRTCSCLHVDVV